MKHQIDLNGSDGNFWALAAMSIHWADDLELDRKKIFQEMKASTYNNALKVFLKYFGDYVEFTKDGEPYEPD